MAETDNYILMRYTYKGRQTVSAIHFLDLRKFIEEYPDAEPGCWVRT